MDNDNQSIEELIVNVNILKISMHVRILIPIFY